MLRRCPSDSLLGSGALYSSGMALSTRDLAAVSICSAAYSSVPSCAAEEGLHWNLVPCPSHLSISGSSEPWSPLSSPVGITFPFLSPLTITPAQSALDFIDHLVPGPSLIVLRLKL